MQNIQQVRTPYADWDEGLQRQFNFIRTCVDATFLASGSHQSDHEGFEVIDNNLTFTNVGVSATIFPQYHTTQKRDLFTVHVKLYNTVKSDSQDYIRSFEAFHGFLTRFHKSKGFVMPEGRQYNPYTTNPFERSLHVWQARHWLGLYDPKYHKRVIIVQGLFHTED